jgi:beta-phosphoglucomutase-like phosphatase (HAD superfamily)
VIRGFLFDLDGTLVDSERETAEAMARALERGGIRIEQYDKTTSSVARGSRSMTRCAGAIRYDVDHVTWSRRPRSCATRCSTITA